MRAILLVLAVAASVGCTPEQKAQTPPTTSPSQATATDPSVHLIGVAAPFTGALRMVGGNVRDGANRAIADINAAGGVLGKPLRAYTVDDGCDPIRAVAAARELAAQGAVLVDGHFCQAAWIVGSSIASSSRAIMISPTFSQDRANVDAAEYGWTHSFRLAPSEAREGEFAARWLARNHRGARIAIVSEGRDYGQRVAAAAQRGLDAAGMPASVSEVTVPFAGLDVLVSRLMSAQTQVVFFAGSLNEAAPLVKRLRAAGSNAIFLGTSTLWSDGFERLAGSAAEGTTIVFPVDPRRSPGAQALIARLKAQGVEPDGYTLRSYAAIQLWAEAARRAGSVERERVAAALRGAPFETVLGTISFDRAGDLADASYTVLVWNKGAFREPGGS